MATGWTKTENDIFDTAIPYLTGSQLKIFLVIYRQTVGFNREWDKIAISQFQKKTGLSKPQVISAIKELSNNEIIEKSIDFNYKLTPEWLKNLTGKKSLLVKKVDRNRLKKLTDSGKKSLPEVVKKVNTQKTYIKETFKETFKEADDPFFEFQNSLPEPEPVTVPKKAPNNDDPFWNACRLTLDPAIQRLRLKIIPKDVILEVLRRATLRWRDYDMFQNMPFPKATLRDIETHTADIYQLHGKHTYMLIMWGAWRLYLEGNDIYVTNNGYSFDLFLSQIKKYITPDNVNEALRRTPQFIEDLANGK